MDDAGRREQTAEEVPNAPTALRRRFRLSVAEAVVVALTRRGRVLSLRTRRACRFLGSLPFRRFLPAAMPR